MKTIPCAPFNYGALRNRDIVTYIAIHYTAVDGDTAENEGSFFSRPHSPKSSAHFFIGQDGTVVKSVALNRVAYSVGGKKWTDCPQTGGGKLYGICTNTNSVSIELCDNLNKDPSKKQIKAVKNTIKYIRKYCPNAKTVVRHFDVTGKHCPLRMMNEMKWAEFEKAIGEK